jgi:hypothetical protein
MSHMVDDFEELAGLFLTEPDPPTRVNGAHNQGAVEVLAVGHLPVRAGLWLAPYADAAARESGPTALVRLDDHGPHLQVLRGGPREAEALGLPSLRDAIAALAPSIQMWVIRPSPSIAPSEIVAAHPDRITILTAGDEAARVQAYTLIKDIVAACGAGRRPDIGLAVAGCDQDTARFVFQRLNQTTTSYLGVELELVLTLPRMDAGLISSGYRCFATEAPPDLTSLLRHIHELGRRREATARQAAEPSPPAEPAPSPWPEAAAVEPPATVDRPAPPPTPAVPPREPPPPPLIEVRAADAEGSAGEPWISRRAAAMGPAASQDVEPKEPCLPREPDADGRPVPLASHVAGLSLLPVRCPNHEPVELAVDQAGRLHLLALEESMRRTAVVRRWAVDHREIISMACPDHAFDPRQDPRIHLFTDRPLSVADLHASDVRLYVRAPVRVGHQVGWYVAPLNLP